MGDRFYFMVKLNPEKHDEVVKYMLESPRTDFRDLQSSSCHDIIYGFSKGTAPEDIKVDMLSLMINELISDYYCMETGV